MTALVGTGEACHGGAEVVSPAPVRIAVGMLVGEVIGQALQMQTRTAEMRGMLHISKILPLSRTSCPSASVTDRDKRVYQLKPYSKTGEPI